jgi:hypothetical protein
MQGHSGRHEMVGTRGIKVWWTLGDGSELSLIANVSGEALEGVEVWNGDHLWLEGFASGDTLSPWSVVFNLRPAA